VSVSVFVEPLMSSSSPAGFLRQGGLNVYSLRQDDHLITVMGETPRATVREIAHSVVHR
jgi:negative regulator of sigma E activity